MADIDTWHHGCAIRSVSRRDIVVNKRIYVCRYPISQEWQAVANIEVCVTRARCVMWIESYICAAAGARKRVPEGMQCQWFQSFSCKNGAARESDLQIFRGLKHDLLPKRKRIRWILISVQAAEEIVVAHG